MIRCFWKKLPSSIQIQLNNQEYDFDWDKKVIEKTANVQVKANLQLALRIKKIDSRSPKDYKPIKKNKNKTN